MKILVTGAAGHVGGAIVQRLMADGHDVQAVVRRSSGSIEGTTTHVFDLSAATPQVLLEQLPVCDAIVHAAACVDFQDHARLMSDNVTATHNVAELAAAWAVQHLAFISTVAVYGRPGSEKLSESSPVAPGNLYAVTKHFGEYRIGIVPETIINLSYRIPSPIGPRLRAQRILKIFLQRALKGEDLVLHGRGGRAQNYLDVRDIADAVARGLETKRSGVVVLGAHEPISNLALAKRVIASTNSTSHIVYSGQADPDESAVWTLDCRRARHWLHWEPKFRLEDSLRDMARELAMENDPCPDDQT